MKEYTIIIPTFNEAKGIEHFLKSLQSLRILCEIIIADGGSTDKTKLLAQPYVDIFLQTEKGRARQMNQAALHASTPVLIFLHADTFLPELALDLIDEGFSLGHQWGRFNMALIGEHSMLKMVSFMMNWRSQLSGIATGDQVIFVNKETFELLGGYPDIALMEDIALSKQLKAITAPYCIKQPVKSSGRRWESFGVGRTILLMWWLRLRYALGASTNHLAILYREGRFI